MTFLIFLNEAMMQTPKLLSRAMLTIAATAIASCTALPRQSAQANVILHAFDWSYQDVADNAEAIADAGYGAVLVTPPLKSPNTGHWSIREV